MTKVKCSYLGNLNCEAIHLQSGSLIRTDAPLDHCGKGESFSPTDLLATSLGTCLLTIMAIKAKSKGFDLKGIYLNCLLYTSPSPRDMRRSRMPSSA